MSTSLITKELTTQMQVPSGDLASALADDRRAHLLQILHQVDMPIGERELARMVAGSETDEDVSEKHVRNVLISLYHFHLPKLEDLGLIEYEYSNGQVTRLVITNTELARYLALENS